MSIEVLTHMVMLPRILEAARLLHDCGLVDREPASYVKEYVQAHPEINALLARSGATP